MKWLPAKHHIPPLASQRISKTPDSLFAEALTLWCCSTSSFAHKISGHLNDQYYSWMAIGQLEIHYHVHIESCKMFLVYLI